MKGRATSQRWSSSPAFNACKAHRENIFVCVCVCGWSLPVARIFLTYCWSHGNTAPVSSKMTMCVHNRLSTISYYTRAHILQYIHLYTVLWAPEMLLEWELEHMLCFLCSTDKETNRRASKKEKTCQCLISFAPEVRETQSNLPQN